MIAVGVVVTLCCLTAFAEDAMCTTPVVCTKVQLMKP